MGLLIGEMAGCMVPVDADEEPGGDTAELPVDTDAEPGGDAAALPVDTDAETEGDTEAEAEPSGTTCDVAGDVTGDVTAPGAEDALGVLRPRLGLLTGETPFKCRSGSSFFAMSMCCCAAVPLPLVHCVIITVSLCRCVPVPVSLCHCRHSVIVAWFRRRRTALKSTQIG